MKAISELNHSVQNPTGEEYFILNQDQGLGVYKSHKVTLSEIRNYIMESNNSESSENSQTQTDRYKITLDPNGGTIDGSSEARTLELSAGPLGDRLPTPTPQPSSEGFAGLRFEGWWTSPEGGTKITRERIVPQSGNITLYAHWIGVIHYKVKNNYDSYQVTLDEHNIASGFRGIQSTGKYCGIWTVEYDKFDFSGNFTIVMKGKLGNGGGKQDVFAGFTVSGYANNLMDFGCNGGIPEWEIAHYNEGGSTISDNFSTRIETNQEFMLKVKRKVEENVINCYVSKDNGQTWIFDYAGTGNGNLAPGRFMIGNDPDSLSEYFRGSIYLDECYLVQSNPNAGNPLGRYILVPSET